MKYTQKHLIKKSANFTYLLLIIHHLENVKGVYESLKSRKRSVYKYCPNSTIQLYWPTLLEGWMSHWSTSFSSRKPAFKRRCLHSSTTEMIKQNGWHTFLPVLVWISTVWGLCCMICCLKALKSCTNTTKMILLSMSSTRWMRVMVQRSGYCKINNLSWAQGCPDYSCWH